MSKHLPGIDLRCKACRALDKVWIVVELICVIGAYILGGWLWLICVAVTVPIMFFFNKHIMRKTPTLHGMFGEIV